MTVLISTLSQNSGCFISKKGIFNNSFYYKCENGHTILKDYCDFKFLKKCNCGEKIIRDGVYLNANPSSMEVQNKLSGVKIPRIFRIDNAPCNTKKLIKENTFDSVNDLPIDISFYKTLGGEVNNKNWRGNTLGHELLLCDSYHKLFPQLEKLYEAGLDIFIENNNGFCLAHIIDIQKHYIKWLCDRNNINPYEEIDEIDFLTKTLS